MIRWFLFLFCKDVPRKDSFNATQQYVQKILNNCLIEFLKELVRNLILLLSVFLFCKCQPILLFFGPFFNFCSHPISSLPFITELKIQFFIYFRKNNPVLLLNTFIIPFASFLFYLFIYFWLPWVFIAACGLSLILGSRGYSSLRSTGFSLWGLLLSSSMGLGGASFNSCDARA